MFGGCQVFAGVLVVAPDGPSRVRAAADVRRRGLGLHRRPMGGTSRCRGFEPEALGQGARYGMLDTNPGEVGGGGGGGGGNVVDAAGGGERRAWPTRRGRSAAGFQARARALSTPDAEQSLASGGGWLQVRPRGSEPGVDCFPFSLQSSTLEERIRFPDLVACPRRRGRSAGWRICIAEPAVVGWLGSFSSGAPSRGGGGLGWTPFPGPRCADSGHRARNGGGPP